ncbi:hypothetical protein [Promicromonospora sp. NPDC057488]|uniref:hypothetical protein n=1 Tax=Promicromonospora sp. NPDC057488 TaxID=3346147 RepID=UPI00366B39FF
MSTDTAPEAAPAGEPSGATPEGLGTTDETGAESRSEAAARAAAWAATARAAATRTAPTGAKATGAKAAGAAQAASPARADATPDAGSGATTGPTPDTESDATSKAEAMSDTPPVPTPEPDPAPEPTPAATPDPSGPDDVPGAPADPGDLPASARPLTAALLNLSGLGLGYLHLRTWLRLVVALAATAGLAWVALPIGREPVAVWWALGYVGALALFAVDAAQLARGRGRGRAGTSPRRTLWSPRTAGRAAWATLAIVPLLGAGYAVAQHEVLEDHLAYDLDRAEASLESVGTTFGSYKDTYDTAYATYVDVAAEHPRTRAADRVPGLVDDLYAQAKSDDPCTGLVVVRHFAEPGTPGPLQEVAQSEIPRALHDCGLRSVEAGKFDMSRTYLSELLADHPSSDPALSVPGNLAEWRDGVLKDLSGKNGCTDTGAAAASAGFLAKFDSGEVSALADEARERVPAELLKCGLKEFERKRYATVVQALNGLVESYPRAKEVDYAERVRIAAGIALVDPEAGVRLPARDEPEGTVTLTVYNYSPDPFQMVYTGPATGVVKIDACDDCKYLPKGEQPVCSGYSLTLPSTTVTLPAGDYLTATRRDKTVLGWEDKGVDKVAFTADGGFCTWSYRY